MAAEQAGLLPLWWDDDKRKACERMGMDHRRENFHNLACAIKKSDVIKHYGDSRFPMQLRMFSETVYKRAPGGMNGTVMRKTMAAMEGGDGPGAMSMLDVSQGLASAQSASRGLEQTITSLESLRDFIHKIRRTEYRQGKRNINHS